MPCVTPIKAYRFLGSIPSGYKSVSLRAPPVGSDYKEVSLPCGKCSECKKKYTLDWALRMQAECQMHDQNCFLTLTYDDDHLHYTKSGLPTLCYDDVTLFIKRLRKFFDCEEKRMIKKGLSWKKPKISYYYCGEYGDLSQRPHYHMILFGWIPPLKDRYVSDSAGDNILYESPLIEKLWSHGICTVQDVTFSACAYVSGYVQKKRKDWDDYKKSLYYGDRLEERSFCSRRPAIGKRFYAKYKFDMFSHDSFVSDGKEFPVPRYFYKQFCHEIDKQFCDESIPIDERLLKLYDKVHSERLENLRDYSDYTLEAIAQISKSKSALRSGRSKI